MSTRDDDARACAGRHAARPGPREPHALLVAHAQDLPPGVAVDVGCGDGADAVWLAERGWRVTGVDASPEALGRARRRAGEAGVADRTSWLQADLAAGVAVPGGADLVSAHGLDVRADVLARLCRGLARAVRPGGTLLVAGSFAPEQVSAELGTGWVLDVAGPDGVVLARRATD